MDPTVDDAQLNEFFKQKFKTVISAKVILDPATKYSRGYGFVKFGGQQDQIRAMKEMNGAFFKSRFIKCNEAVMKSQLLSQQQEQSQFGQMNSMNPQQQQFMNMYAQNYWMNPY